MGSGCPHWRPPGWVLKIPCCCFEGWIQPGMACELECQHCWRALNLMPTLAQQSVAVWPGAQTHGFKLNGSSMWGQSSQVWTAQKHNLSMWHVVRCNLIRWAPLPESPSVRNMIHPILFSYFESCVLLEINLTVGPTLIGVKSGPLPKDGDSMLSSWILRMWGAPLIHSPASLLHWTIANEIHQASPY